MSLTRTSSQADSSDTDHSDTSQTSSRDLQHDVITSGNRRSMFSSERLDMILANLRDRLNRFDAMDYRMQSNEERPLMAAASDVQSGSRKNTDALLRATDAGNINSINNNDYSV